MTPEHQEKTFLPSLSIQLIGTGFFTGYFPIAPGTAGSLLCIAILWLLPPVNWLWLSAAALALFLIGVSVSGILARSWGPDPGKVNIDEVTGMIVSLIAVPKIWLIWLAAFLLFRFFDIIKPPPAKRLEFLPGGWGIMLDDIAAAMYANVCCQLLRLFI